MIRRGLYTLALHVKEGSQKLSTNMTRVGSGFLAEQNLNEAERVLWDIHKSIQDMRKLIKAQEEEEARKSKL